MERKAVNKYEKVDKILINITISFFIMLIISQWYLRLENNGIEPFLNKMYNKDGIRVEIVDIIPD